MLGVDVGHHRDHRREHEKGAVALVRQSSTINTAPAEESNPVLLPERWDRAFGIAFAVLLTHSYRIRFKLIRDECEKAQPSRYCFAD